MATETPDFYLSEMSVSNLHGGGLTIQRVLGKQLDFISLFAHLSKFALEYPPCPQVGVRSVPLLMWLESDAAKKSFGCRPTFWLSQQPLVIRAYAKGIASDILRYLRHVRHPVKGLICPQGTRSLYAAKELVRRKTEYVTWIMDDHLVTWDGGWRYPSGVERLLRDHLRDARAVFTISPTMRDFFRNRFGTDSRVLFAPADLKGDPVWDAPHDSEQVRLAYFGAVWRWQVDALDILARHLHDANASLDIYTPQSSKVLANVPGVRFQAPIRPENVMATMRSYDAVVLPASYDSRLRNLTEFNIATKMSECLASGTITLVVAPPYAAMVRFLKGSDAAIVVKTPDKRGVVEAIGMLRDLGHRRSVLRAAVNLVQRRLSTEAMRLVWNEGISAFN